MLSSYKREMRSDILQSTEGGREEGFKGAISSRCLKVSEVRETWVFFVPLCHDKSFTQYIPKIKTKYWKMSQNDWLLSFLDAFLYILSTRCS